MKIVTHSGLFHADEVSAVALLRAFEFEVEVKRLPHQTPVEELDHYDMVIDLGRRFDGIKYFDHHQNKESDKASAGLVWDWIQSQLSIEGKYPVIDNLVSMVDAQDTGARKAGKFEFPQIVTSCNAPNIYGAEQDEAFAEAVAFAEKFILSIKREQDEISRAEEICSRAKVLSDEGLPDIVELPEFHRLWNTQINGEKRPEIEAVIWFDQTQQKWKAQVTPKKPGSFEFNGRKFLPNDSMEFVHAAGFFAVCKDRETMIGFLKTSR